MKIRHLVLATAATMMVGTQMAAAQNFAPPPGSDPYGYYSRYDGDGYYDRNGRYQRYSYDRDDRGRGPDRGDYGPPPPSGDSYYREGTYESNCRSSSNNQVAGTIFGAIAGGLIGSAASRGNGAATVGGVLLGGLVGNALTRNISCDDQPYAFRSYADGLNGPVGRRSSWRHGDNYGYFTPTREFRRNGYECRSFSTTTYSRGRTYTESGTACRQNDGNWHFE